jgi:hypothetical protein
MFVSIIPSAFIRGYLTVKKNSSFPPLSYLLFRVGLWLLLSSNVLLAIIFLFHLKSRWSLMKLHKGYAEGGRVVTNEIAQRVCRGR